MADSELDVKGFVAVCGEGWREEVGGSGVGFCDFDGGEGGEGGDGVYCGVLTDLGSKRGSGRWGFERGKEGGV